MDQEWNRNTKCEQGWRCRSDRFQLWQQTVAAWRGCTVCTRADDRPSHTYSLKPGMEVGQPPPHMRLKKSYCWLTVWSRSFIGLSGPRQTSRQKHHLKTRNWANPSDDWICGVSQIKKEQERNPLLHKLDVGCSLSTITDWKGEPRKRGENRERIEKFYRQIS